MSAMLFDVFFIEMINMLEKSTDEVRVVDHHHQRGVVVLNSA